MPGEHRFCRPSPAAPTMRVARLAAALALALAAGTAEATTFSAGNEAELVQAITDANANAGFDTIELTADITLGAAPPAITDALTIEGTGGVRAIRRDDSGANACSWIATNAFRLLDASADLTLRGISLSGGCNLADQGGAVRVQNAAFRLESSTVSGNHTFVENPDYLYAQGIGGGIAVLYGSATITESTISGNTANGLLESGGGIATFYASELRIERSTVSGNVSTGPFGGGLYMVGDITGYTLSTVTIADSTIADNRLDNRYALYEGEYQALGGGLGVYFAELHIADSRFTGNEASAASGYARGGAISLWNYPDVATDSRIERTLIAGNRVTGAQYGFGGGIRTSNSAVTVTGSAIVGNSVDVTSKARAGGFMIETGDVTLIDSTVSGNAISGPVNEGGGGIMVLSEAAHAASLALVNSTVADNASPNSHAGGILFKRETDDSAQPTALIESSIVAGNTGIGGFEEIGVGPDGTAPVVVANRSLVRGIVDVGAGTFLPDATTLALLGADPLLQPLAYNGGTTPTHALAPASPAIDQGSNTLDLDFDQRGAPWSRAIATPDIGAYELDTERIFAGGFD
jgi:parallel beta helix pectate lyase-like protein